LAKRHRFSTRNIQHIIRRLRGGGTQCSAVEGRRERTAASFDPVQENVASIGAVRYNAVDSGKTATGLYLIGLGLGDPSDITVKGLRVLRRCKYAYLEGYTSLMSCSKDEMEEIFGRKILHADRDFVESRADFILDQARNSSVALMVVGSPLSATTHYDIVLQARKLGISVFIIPNASIMDAVGVCGLQLYNFGQTVTIPEFEGNWRPTSFMDKIEANRKNGLHTLCLLDIKAKEHMEKPQFPNENEFSSLSSNPPPRCLTVSSAARQILSVAGKKNQLLSKREKRRLKKRLQVAETEAAEPAMIPNLGPDTIAVGLARVGSANMSIVVDTLAALRDDVDMGPPLHCLIIPAPDQYLHFLEKDALAMFRNQPLPVDRR